MRACSALTATFALRQRAAHKALGHGVLGADAVFSSDIDDQTRLQRHFPGMRHLAL